MANIHPTAVIDPRAEIASDVTIGPFCVVEGDVAIHSGCRLASHVMVKSGTVLGENNMVYEGSVLGGRPQHLRAGERVGRLMIGNGNTVRENVTMHVAVHENTYTVVGHNNFLMVNVHIAHDCQVGDNVIFDPAADKGFQPVTILIPDLIERVVHARQLNLCEFPKALYRV